MAGLPGVGKTTLARALADKLGGVVLSKDEVRAALFPGAMSDYSHEQDDLCFGAALHAAAYLASHRRTEWVFLDGRTFSRREQIEAAIAAAEAAGCSWKILHVTASDALVEARLRSGDADHPAGNRNVALYREVKARFEPITLPKFEVDMSGDLEQAVRNALEYL